MICDAGVFPPSSLFAPCVLLCVASDAVLLSVGLTAVGNLRSTLTTSPLEVPLRPDAGGREEAVGLRAGAGEEEEAAGRERPATGDAGMEMLSPERGKEGEARGEGRAVDKRCCLG